MTSIHSISESWVIDPESPILPPNNVLRLTRNNAHYIVNEEDPDILERSISSFEWPKGTIVSQPLRSTFLSE
jgi:hypothetical protein